MEVLWLDLCTMHVVSWHDLGVGCCGRVVGVLWSCSWCTVEMWFVCCGGVAGV